MRAFLANATFINFAVALLAVGHMTISSGTAFAWGSNSGNHGTPAPAVPGQQPPAKKAELTDDQKKNCRG